MNKKILVFITTLALLICMAFPACAATYGYNATSAEDSSAIISQSIYDSYGIEAYYAVDNSISDEYGAQSLAESTYEAYAKTDNAIIFSTTATEYGVFAWGAGKSYKAYLDSSEIYSDLKDYDSAGEDEMAAVTFFNDLSLVLSEHFIALGEQNTPVSDGSRVVDMADILTDSEEAELLAKLDEISNRQQFDIVVVTTDTLGGKSPMAYADDYYDYNGYGYGANHDGCLLLVSMEDRDWWLSTTGYGITAITDAGIEYIGDQFVSYLSDADYAAGFDKFADLVDEFVTQAKSGEPYDVGNMSHSTKDTLIGICVAIGISLVIALIAVLKIKKDYKPVRFNASASNYLVPGSFMVTGSYDNFVTTSVSKTRRESSSSGGGSSTHSGSSGTSHGGGGGKF